MADSQILRVWGKADNLDIEFTQKEGNRWDCNVPPDLTDGKYAVELWVINNFNETSYWTGWLYMNGGVCCLKINAQRYVLSLLPYALNMQPIVQGRSIAMLPVDINAELLTQHIDIKIWRCSHG